MNSKPAFASICASLVLFFATGCASQGYSVRIIPSSDPETTHYSITGIETNMDDPFYAALYDAFERCSGKVEGGMAEVNFRSSSKLPSWSEADGWYFADVECVDPGQEGAYQFRLD